MIASGEMDAKYHLVTFSMDSTHNLIHKIDGYTVKQQWSYKLKNIAYNILVSNYIYLFKYYS
jgi:hypothetical protein